MQPSSAEVEKRGRQPAAAEETGQSWEYRLRKYLLLLATLVVTVTYAAGFNPPGGVWQDTRDGQLAGDPIIRATHYHWYLAFYYCNATAFAASLVVIVLILVLAISHDKKIEEGKETTVLVSLRVFMGLDVLSLMSAYGAGTYRDVVTAVLYCTVSVGTVLVYVVCIITMKRLSCFPVKKSESVSGRAKGKERHCKILMLLATFAASVTYVAGLSTPGGFWDSTGGSHHPGDPILRDRHDLRLTVFLFCNTTAFVASLFITMQLIIDRKLHEEQEVGLPRKYALYACIIIALVGLVSAYIAGSCRETRTTVSVIIILVGASICIRLVLSKWMSSKIKEVAPKWLCCRSSPAHQNGENQQTDNAREAVDKARSLVLLLATLAATITYTAGLDPPGGLWQDNGDGHMAGDPILLTTNARRYKAFYYCNSAALVTSLVAIILVQNKLLLKHYVLEVAMILVLFGLMGAYAAGSCRDVDTSIYAMALAGVVLIYVVIHVVIFTLDHKDKQGDEELLEKRRKRLLLFAILAATITYQAGLTPPGGFLLRDDEFRHRAGDPILLHNFPRRYNAFFYCNMVSFMLSIALIILLVNPNLYRPAVRSNALSVCAAVGLFGFLVGYAAGSTQHIKTSIYIFVVVAVVLLFAAVLLALFLWTEVRRNGNSAGKVEINDNSVAGAPSEPEGNGVSLGEGEEQKEEEHKKETKEEEKQGKKEHTEHKYVMLLGILVASITYQAGLKPPGGAWQSSGNGYEAGNPVMHDNRTPQYLTFFYNNSISFVESILVIIMLLRYWLIKEYEDWSLRVMKITTMVNFVALLVAYTVGSSRSWKTSLRVAALSVALQGYLAIIILCLSCHHHLAKKPSMASNQGNPPA
ncbi:hypothetical protein ACQJBY_071082 [Aegilops geniculata]